MTTHTYIKHFIMLLLTLSVHWVVYHKQRAISGLTPKGLPNAKPQSCLTAFSQTDEKLPECNWLPTTLPSSNAFFGIHKHKA